MSVKKLALDLYHSLVLPHIDYGVVLYDAMGTVDGQKLQTIQNKCLRICCKSDPRTAINELHAESKLPRLETRRRFHVCNFVHRGITNESSNNVNALFQPISNLHNLNTRANSYMKLIIPTTRLKTCEQNVKIRGARYYNQLQGDVRNATSNMSFKLRAKKHLYGIT